MGRGENGSVGASSIAPTHDTARDRATCDDPQLMRALPNIGPQFAPACSSFCMPKRKPREVKGFELELVKLIDAASPGRIELSRTKPIFDGGRTGFSVTLETRSTTCQYLDEGLAEIVDVALHDLESGEEDPIRPMWHRLSRFQREAVTRLLDMFAAKHMARAARARLGAGRSAAAEYDLADAFHAALVELRSVHDDDESGMPLPGTPKLEAGPPEPIRVATPPKRPKKHTSTYPPEG